jgi:hypothetical protein
VRGTDANAVGLPDGGIDRRCLRHVVCHSAACAAVTGGKPDSVANGCGLTHRHDLSGSLTCDWRWFGGGDRVGRATGAFGARGERRLGQVPAPVAAGNRAPRCRRAGRCVRIRVVASRTDVVRPGGSDCRLGRDGRPRRIAMDCPGRRREPGARYGDVGRRPNARPRRRCPNRRAIAQRLWIRPFGMDTGGGPSALEDITIKFNRPFLFLVRDVETGAILFMGRVVDPSDTP